MLLLQSTTDLISDLIHLLGLFYSSDALLYLFDINEKNLTRLNILI